MKLLMELRKQLHIFRENKDEWNWYTSHSDLFLSVYRHPDDEDYFVLVTKDFYETYIPFEREDYE